MTAFLCHKPDLGTVGMYSLRAVNHYCMLLRLFMYHSLAKKCPWAEHLNSLSKRGVDTLLSVSTFNHERVPMSCLQRLDAHEANNWTNNNSVQRSHQRLLTQSLMVHNTLNSTICHRELTALVMSIYAKVPCNVTRSFLPQICVALVAVVLKLHDMLH